MNILFRQDLPSLVRLLVVTVMGWYVAPIGTVAVREVPVAAERHPVRREVLGVGLRLDLKPGFVRVHLRFSFRGPEHRRGEHG